MNGMFDLPPHLVVDKCLQGFPTKNVMILLVTITAWEGVDLIYDITNLQVRILFVWLGKISSYMDFDFGWLVYCRFNPDADFFYLPSVIAERGGLLRSSSLSTISATGFTTFSGLSW